MVHSIDELTQGAIELPPDQRYTLAQRILASVEPPGDAEIHRAWAEEIQERIRRFDSGEAKVFQRTTRTIGGLVFAKTVRVISELVDQPGQSLLALAGQRAEELPSCGGQHGFVCLESHFRNGT